MMKNPLPNNRDPKSERETNAAIVNILFLRIYRIWIVFLSY